MSCHLAGRGATTSLDAARVEWNAYDLVTPAGKKIEVKSAAYLQSWKQSKPSKIVFGIQPTLGWDAGTNEYGSERRRQADAYVFALLHHQERETLDPLDLDQWAFYALPTNVLDARCPVQRTISLRSLLALKPDIAEFGGIRGVLETLLDGRG